MMKFAKKGIPKALKNTVWLTYVGKKFESKCHVKWCKTIIDPFTFEAGHNIPESKGGDTSVANLRPICAQCNKSMGNRFTIDEFSNMYSGKPTRKGALATLMGCILSRSNSIAPLPPQLANANANKDANANVGANQNECNNEYDSESSFATQQNTWRSNAKHKMNSQEASSKGSNRLKSNAKSKSTSLSRISDEFHSI